MKPSELLSEIELVAKHSWRKAVLVLLVLAGLMVGWEYIKTRIDERAKRDAAEPISSAIAASSATPSPEPEPPDVAFSWTAVAGEEVRLGPAKKLDDETRKGRRQYVLTVVSNTKSQPVSVDVSLQFRQDVAMAVVADNSGADDVKLPPEILARVLRQGPGAAVEFNEGAADTSSEIEIGIKRLQPGGARVAILIELQDAPDDEAPSKIPEEKVHNLWAHAVTNIEGSQRKEPYFAPFLTEIDGSVTMPPVVHGDAAPKDTRRQVSRSFSGGAKLKVGGPGSKSAIMP